MSRKRVVDGAVAAVLALLALVVALPFRAEALHLTPLVSLGWDAALHATEGLDLFDDMRLGRPLDAFSLLVSRHWWGPAWALVSAPFQAAFGPSLAAASLPSLVAFVLAPAVAFLLARRLVPAMGPVSAVLTGLVVAGLFLRSPMLLEISAWPMLESLGGLVALVAFLFFARREEPGARRMAFLAGTLLFLLKYHFGFFVLATLGFVVWREESPGSKRRLAAAARALLLRGAGSGILALAFLLSAVRVERRLGRLLTPRPFRRREAAVARGGVERGVGDPSRPRSLRRSAVCRVVSRSREHARLVPADLSAHGGARTKPSREAFGLLGIPARGLHDRRGSRRARGSRPRSRSRPAGRQDAPCARGFRDLAGGRHVAERIPRGAALSRVPGAGPFCGGRLGPRGGSVMAGKMVAGGRARSFGRDSRHGARRYALAGDDGGARGVPVLIRRGGNSGDRSGHRGGPRGGARRRAPFRGSAGLAHGAPRAPSLSPRSRARGRGRGGEPVSVRSAG